MNNIKISTALVLIQFLFPINALAFQSNLYEKYKLSDYIVTKDTSAIFNIKNIKYYRDRSNNRKKLDKCQSYQESISIGISATSFSSALIAFGPEEIPKCFPRKIPKA